MDGPTFVGLDREPNHTTVVVADPDTVRDDSAWAPYATMLRMGRVAGAVMQLGLETFDGELCTTEEVPPSARARTLGSTQATRAARRVCTAATPDAHTAQGRRRVAAAGQRTHPMRVA